MMKDVLKFALVFISLITFSNTASAQKATETAIIKTTIYCDHCKACDDCGGRLEKNLLREKGIQMVTLDDEAMAIKVVYNSKKTDLKTIRQAISKQGYDADDVKADPVVYESLDGCCKK